MTFAFHQLGGPNLGTRRRQCDLGTGVHPDHGWLPYSKWKQDTIYIKNQAWNVGSADVSLKLRVEGQDQHVFVMTLLDKI